MTNSPRALNRLLTLATATAALTLTTAARADLPNGVAAGEVTTSSATLWAHSTTTGNLTFLVSTDPTFATSQSVVTSVTDSTLPVKANVTGLNPNATYYYKATDASNTAATGTFKTAAAAGNQAGLEFGVSGDWRGELAPYPSVKNVPGKKLNFFVELGDTIYADYPTTAVPAAQAKTLADFRAKHNEVYSAKAGLNALADLRASTAVFSTIDDHEVTDNFAGGAPTSSDRSTSDGVTNRFLAAFPGDDPTAPIHNSTLFKNGIQAFTEYNPINPQTYNTPTDSNSNGQAKFYRSQTYGKDAISIVLDERSFRSQELTPVSDPTNPAAVGAFITAAYNPTRTILGLSQFHDLENDLLHAQQTGVTWKFVNIPEPIENLGPVGAEDRYEGYASERDALLHFIDVNNITNTVFITADIHGTITNNLTYGPPGNLHNVKAWEISTGPVAFDAPFGPTIFNLAANIPLGGGTTNLSDYFLAQFGAAIGISGLNHTTLNFLPQSVKDQALKAFLNSQLAQLGCSPIGLQDSSIPATLTVGDYLSTYTYGWTDFKVDPLTEKLTVSTYGIPYYTVDQAAANPDAVAALNPSIVSQFTVDAVPEPTSIGLLLAGAPLLLRRRK